MSYGIYKQTYADSRAYRYQIVSEGDQVCYLAEPTGLLLPNPTRLVTLFDADHAPIGRIEPSVSPRWRRGGEYVLLLEEREEPLVVVEECWGLVDLILLRLPRYVLHLWERTYVARGSRYGERLYEIFLPPEGWEEEPVVEELEGVEGLGLEIGDLVEAEGPEAELVMEGLDEDEMREALAEIVRNRWGEPVGEVRRPARGPSYVVEAEAASLRQTPLVLAALVILVDMHLHPQLV
jgi:hypothetical protein